MLSPRKRQANDQGCNDEHSSLNCQELQKSKQTSERAMGRNVGQSGIQRADSMGDKEKIGRECPKWVYVTIIIILTGFLVVEYIAQIRTSHRNSSKFVNNVKALKQMDKKDEGTPVSFAYFQQTGQQQGAGVGVPAGQQKINLKLNQALIQPLTQSDLVQEGGNTNFVGYIDMESAAPAEGRPKSIAHQDRNADVYTPPEPSFQVVSGDENGEQPAAQTGMFRIPSTSKLYSQINQPPQDPQQANTPNGFDDIKPIIQPFNHIQSQPGPSNIYTSFAGVSTEQLAQAREFRKILDGDVFSESSQSNRQREYYKSKYNTDKYEQLPFCIVVPTFNNAQEGRYLRNIKSIVMQDYKNYHIVVIDDASTDSTGELIRTFLAGQAKVKPSSYEILRNEKQLRAMSNLRTAAKNHCKPQQIFLIVDGDDQLLGKQVLKLYNAVFQQRKLWFVYSNFLTSTGSIGYSRPFPISTIKSKGYRSYPFVTSHLRAFYTQLLVNIKEEDLKDEHGEYIKAANDVAICIPILEQSHERVGYLPEITYYYNSNTGLNNHQLRLNEQRKNDRRTRTHPVYKRLTNLLD